MASILRFLFGKKILFLLIGLAPVLALFSAFLIQKAPVRLHAEEVAGDFQVLASYQEQATEQSPAERIMRTLSSAYPELIGPVEYRKLNDSPAWDWAFLVGGRWFYYAEGRILPEEHMGRIAEYSPMRFQQAYPAQLPPWEDMAADRATMTRNMEESRARRAEGRQTQPVRLRRPQYFLEALWNISNRNEASAQQIRMNFLGRSLTIHSHLAPKISQIEEIILNEARTKPTVRQWIDSLGTVTGWNWRNIGNTANRSLHSYGIAIDILPVNLGGLATYWAWTSGHNPQWWNIPYSGRWHPPDEVIAAFESFGFVWGGKWINHFDTMHFEYRPEVFILSNVPMANFAVKAGVQH